MSKPELDDMNKFAALWQQQAVGDTSTVVNTEKRKRHRLFLQDWAWALVMLVSGIVFLSISQTAVFVVAAIALFTGAVLQLRQAYFNRRKMLHYKDWGALGLLEYRLLANETERKRFRYSQYGAAVIILFTVLLALLKYAFDMTVPDELIRAYYIIMPFMIALICFNQWRIIQNRKKMAYLQQLINEFVKANEF